VRKVTTITTKNATNVTTSKDSRPYTLAADSEARRLINILRYIFLGLMLVGYVFYPLDLWILGHWTENWQSRIPFYIALPSVIFTVLMLVNYRLKWIRYPFIALMVLNLATGVAGALLHLVFNFEGEYNWTMEGLREAFEGFRPVLAALAFAHLGVTGLLCSIVAPRKKENV